MKIKNTLFLFCLCSLFLLSSCFDQDEEDGITPSTDTLKGTWLMTAIDYEGNTVTSVAGFDDTRADFVGVGKDIDYTIQFTDNSFLTSGGYTVDLTTTAFGQSFTQTVAGIEYISSGSWSLDGDQLTTTAQGEDPVTATIANLTENSFDMVFDLAIVKNEFGATVTQKVKGTMKYVRQ